MGEKTLRGLDQDLRRCQHRRDQRIKPRVSRLANALHNYLLNFSVMLVQQSSEQAGEKLSDWSAMPKEFAKLRTLRDSNRGR